MNQTEIVNNFLRKVYLWVAIALVISGVAATLTASSSVLLGIVYSGWFIPIIIVELLLVIVISWAIDKLSQGMIAFLFILYSLFTGFTLSFIFIVYTLGSVTMVFFLTAIIFLLMSIVGYVTKKDLSALGPILFVGLIGIIIAMIVNMFLRSPMMTYIVSILAVVIFVGLIIYDTQRLKKVALRAGNNAGKYAIRGALSLYLDFINLFLHLLRLLGKRR